MFDAFRRWGYLEADLDPLGQFKPAPNAELRASGHTEPNPAVWQALLNLAKAGRFRGRCVPCFFGSSETSYGIHRKAADGEHGLNAAAKSYGRKSPR